MTERKRAKAEKLVWCHMCLRYLPITSFNKNKGRSTGLTSRCKLCQKKRKRKLTNARRQSNLRRQCKYRKKYPGKHRARLAVGLAIKKGILSRFPCCRCGEAKAYAHHDDYRKPLKVRWLCHPHHVETHLGRLPL